jgi:hypothetical protein
MRVATGLSRAGTAGLLVLVGLDLVGALELTGAWLAVGAGFVALWLGPPLALTASATLGSRRSDRRSWRSLQDRLGEEHAREAADRDG